MEKEEEIFRRTGELYRKYGIRSVTMDDVARELGISKKTLYHFVRDKEELVKKVTDLDFREIHQCLGGSREQVGNAIEELLEISRFVSLHLKDYSPSFDYDLKKYYPEISEDIHRRKREVMFEMILQNMKRGKKEGLYRGELKEEIIARLYVSRLESMHDNPMFSVDEFISGEIFREIFTYHIMGIANEEGKRFFLMNRHKLQVMTEK